MNGSFETWRNWLLGLEAPFVGRISQAKLSFAGGWPSWTAGALLLAGLIWFGYQYWRDGKSPSLWVKTPLLFLRLLALAAAALMLAQPVLRLTRQEKQRAAAIVLVDVSDSMGFRDPRLPASRAAAVERATGLRSRSASRSEVAAQLLAGRTALLRTLAARFDTRVYAFAAGAQSVALKPGADPAAAGRALAAAPLGRTSTQIGPALKQALDDVAGRPVAGALLLTDGGSNQGDDPVAWARQAAKQGVVVSAAALGDPTPTRNLTLTEALADQVVRKDNTVQVFAGLQHRGYEGRTITVSLRRNGAPFQSQPLRLGPAGRKQTVTFTYTPKEPGTFAYSVQASVLEGETTSQDNARRFMQQVVTKRLRVLYVEGEPRWEYRYLRNAILRDTQLDFACLLTEAEDPGAGEGNVAVTAFPADEQALFAYDIIILGDVPVSRFNDLQLRSLRRFVEDKGGSLIVIAGEKHMPHEYAGTLLEAVLPVSIRSTPEQVITDDPFFWEVTPAGRQDSLLRMSDDPAENARIWRELPGMFWQAGVERAKPGATVLVANSARSNASGKRVVLAIQPFGAGRCLMGLADSTWRWRWRVGDRYFYRYWGQAIRAMTPHENPGGNRYAQVNADKSEYNLGDRVALTARLLDRFYRPVKSATVTASISGSSGVSLQLPMRPVPGSPGLFSAEAPADRVGDYKVSAASPAAPGSAATARYLVQSQALEQQQPEMDEALLRKLTAASGGSMPAPDQVADWAKGLRGRELTVRSEIESEVWDSPLLLILFAAPLLLEWLIRKRSGLA